jgi:hypothetical protein
MHRDPLIVALPDPTDRIPRYICFSVVVESPEEVLVVPAEPKLAPECLHDCGTDLDMSQFITTVVENARITQCIWSLHCHLPCLPTRHYICGAEKAKHNKRKGPRSDRGPLSDYLVSHLYATVPPTTITNVAHPCQLRSTNGFVRVLVGFLLERRLRQ